MSILVEVNSILVNDLKVDEFKTKTQLKKFISKYVTKGKRLTGEYAELYYLTIKGWEEYTND